MKLASSALGAIKKQRKNRLTDSRQRLMDSPKTAVDGSSASSSCNKQARSCGPNGTAVEQAEKNNNAPDDALTDAGENQQESSSQVISNLNAYTQPTTHETSSDGNLLLGATSEILDDIYMDANRRQSKLPSLTSTGEFEKRTKINPFSPPHFYQKQSDSSNASVPFLNRLPSPTSLSNNRRSFRRSSRVNDSTKNIWTTGKNDWMDDGKKSHHHRQQPQLLQHQQRLVFKNGECNVTRANIKKRRQRYMADIFTTLVDIKWRWNLLNFVLAFTLSWLIFALAWWLICFSHSDFENYGKPDHKPCVEEVYDFTTALLFSIETQQTIGFGSRRMNQYCPEAIMVMMCQSCFGVIIQALMTGLVFAKLSRPKKRAETLLFSKNALICKRDGQLCLLFRVGDMRKSHIVEAHVKVIMIKRRVTDEGEIIPLYQYDLMLGDGDSEGRLFMVWPLIVEHRIDEDSPFWELSAEDLRREQFELVVVLEGIVESTGMTTQARTSYLPSEILWGHRFEKLVTFQKESGQYFIDYSRFHSTVAVEIPQCSAKEMQSQTGDSSDDSDDSDEEDEDNLTASIKSDSLMRLDPHSRVSSGRGRDRSGPKVDAGALADLILATSSVSNLQPGEKSRLDNQENSLIDDQPGFLMSRKPSLYVGHQGDLPKRYSEPSLRKKNGINSVALAAFDLQNEEQQQQQQNRGCLEEVVSCENSTIVEATTFRLV